MVSCVINHRSHSCRPTCHLSLSLPLPLPPLPSLAHMLFLSIRIVVLQNSFKILCALSLSEAASIASLALTKFKLRDHICLTTPCTKWYVLLQCKHYTHITFTSSISTFSHPLINKYSPIGALKCYLPLF